MAVSSVLHKAVAMGIKVLLVTHVIFFNIATPVNSLPMSDLDGIAAAPKQEKYKAMLSAAKAIENDIIDIRRTLHRRPAIKYEEYEAQALVIETLTELGLRYVSYHMISYSCAYHPMCVYIRICYSYTCTCAVLTPLR